MKQKKIFTIALLGMVVALIGTGALYYTFRSSPDSVEKMNPDYTVSAEELVNACELDEASANEKYLDKIVLVEGKVVDITDQQQEKITIYLEGSFTGNVSCSFAQESIDKTAVSEGSEMHVKGKCTGYIMDVVLTKCSLDD